MAATDYIIVQGWQNCYLAKKKKPTKNGPQTMSSDRRVIEDGEIIGLFEFYLRRWSETHKGGTLVINDSFGKQLFEAKLLDVEKEED